MAVDIIREVLPGADVRWERTPRVKPERLTVSAGKDGMLVEVAQRDVSDHYRGKGVDDIRDAVRAYKASRGL